MTRLRGYFPPSGWRALAAVILAGAVLHAAACAQDAAAAQDKDSYVPMPLDGGFGPLDSAAPSIPAEQIIQKFAARETVFQEALSHYVYRRTLKIDTINDIARDVDGEWYEEDDVNFDAEGQRTEKTVYAPQSTLRRIHLSPSDLEDFQHGYGFVLTTDEISSYNISYAGRQKVDDVSCYVFDVSPKQIEKNRRYLLGRIWVDEQDFQIVITDGRMVPDGTKKGAEDLHPPFMTWRELIDGQYWFPTYVKAEGVLHFKGGRRSMGADVHIREVIKCSEYKRMGVADGVRPGNAAP